MQKKIMRKFNIKSQLVLIFRKIFRRQRDLYMNKGIDYFKSLNVENFPNIIVHATLGRLNFF